MMTPHDLLSTSNRIIIKIGSALITDIQYGTVRENWLASLAQDISTLKKQGKDIIIVSSGAIALGRKSLDIESKTPTKNLKIDQKQAAASIGQIALINAFQTTFSACGLKTSQILLNPDDTENRRTHLNARSTIETFLKHDFIPVINENDTTATDEIRFGDNDKLAARVAQMISADLLLILSTTDGLYTDNPAENDKASHIPLVEKIDETILRSAKESVSGISSGGMKSKIESAAIAVQAGTHVIITSGKDKSPIKGLSQNKRSTLLKAEDTPHNAKKRWIAAHLHPKGKVIIDAGAVTALNAGRSLLPVGMTSVSGQFERGDVVEIYAPDQTKIALGLSNYALDDAKIIMGCKSTELPDLLGYHGRDDFIHRNDLVLLKGGSV